MRRIEIQYFAVLREIVGHSRETVETSATTPAELYAELAERHDLPTDRRFKVAVNDVFGDWSQLLEDGDQVVFIPPVAGG